MIYFRPNWTIANIGGEALRQYDNLSRSLVVRDVPEGYTWRLLVQAGQNFDVILLSPMEDGVGVVLTADQLSVSGHYTVQLQGTLNADGKTVRHTNCLQLYVPKSLSGSANWPAVPSEFTQMEANIQEINQHPPIPGDNGYYLIWDVTTHAYQESKLPVTGGGSDANAVKFTPQTLTAEQQKQARENIGADDYIVLSAFDDILTTTARSGVCIGGAHGGSPAGMSFPALFMKGTQNHGMQDILFLDFAGACWQGAFVQGKWGTFRKISNESILAVKLTATTSGDETTYSIDKTFAEIKAAYEAGKYVYAYGKPIEDLEASLVQLQLTAIGDTSVSFTGLEYHATHITDFGTAGTDIATLDIAVKSDGSLGVSFYTDKGSATFPLPNKWLFKVTIQDGVVTPTVSPADNQIWFFTPMFHGNMGFAVTVDLVDSAKWEKSEASIFAFETSSYTENDDGSSTDIYTWVRRTDDASERITYTLVTPAEGDATETWGYEKKSTAPDISLGLTSAAVGQIAKITAVDAAGKPTAWEAVDLPSGGGEKWEKIAEIVIPEGAEETNALTINKDLNGNPFRLVKARLCAKYPKYTGKSTIPTSAFAMINGGSYGASAPLAYTSAWALPSKTVFAGMVYEVDVSGAQQIEEVSRSSGGGLSDDYGKTFSTYTATSSSFARYIADAVIANPITSIGGSNLLIFPGCKFVLFGVRE